MRRSMRGHRVTRCLSDCAMYQLIERSRATGELIQSTLWPTVPDAVLFLAERVPDLTLGDVEYRLLEGYGVRLGQRYVRMLFVQPTVRQEPGIAWLMWTRHAEQMLERLRKDDSTDWSLAIRKHLQRAVEARRLADAV